MSQINIDKIDKIINHLIYYAEWHNNRFGYVPFEVIEELTQFSTTKNTHKE